MKKIIIKLMLVLFFSIISVALSGANGFAQPVYDPSLYTILIVTDFRASGPGINNNGEISYIAGTSDGSTAVFSSERGQLTSPDGNARFTDINDNGEVVYAGVNPIGDLHVRSTVRGYIAIGNGPGINNLGEICYYSLGDLPSGVYTNERGLVTATNQDTGIPDINDNGEIVYTDADTNNILQVFSTTRGQLTESGRAYATINNYGDVVFTDGSSLMTLDGIQLIQFERINMIDMNDYGDVVFDIGGLGSWGAHNPDSRIYLATQRPDYYPQFPPLIRPPLADAGPDQTVDTVSACNRTATLDGSASTDPDSTPGTNDDIVSFEWLDNGTPIGTGETLEYTFDLGVHTVTLIVTDSTGEADTDEVVITVLDTTPPQVTAELLLVGKSNVEDQGVYRIQYDCSDNCDIDVTPTAEIKCSVYSGEELKWKSGKGFSGLDTKSFSLVVTCEDSSGNVGIAETAP